MGTRIAGSLVVVVAALGAATATAHATATGIITTVAGKSAHGPQDGVPATEQGFSGPLGVSGTADGGFLIADSYDNRIRRVRPDGIITTVAGGGTSTAEGVAATSANLNFPTDVEATPDGGFLIVENRRNRVRKVGPDGVIRTVAGGSDGALGDGGPAVGAGLYYPWSVTVLPGGWFAVSQPFSYRVRRVWPDGVITTVLGDGLHHFDDDVPGTQTGSQFPYGVAAGPDGSIYVAEDYGAKIRRLEPQASRSAPPAIVRRFAGTGEQGHDHRLGQSALLSPFGRLSDVAVAPDGSVVLALTGVHDEDEYFDEDPRDPTPFGYVRLYRVDEDGILRHLAGNGSLGYQGDGGPATAAPIGRPRGIAVGRDGSVLITDVSYLKIRRIDAGLVKPDTGGGGDPGGGEDPGGEEKPGGGEKPGGEERPGGAVPGGDRGPGGDVRPPGGDGPGGGTPRQAFELRVLGASSRTVRRGRPAKLRVRVSMPARAVLEVRRSGRRVARRSVRLAAGAGVVRIPALRRGRYVVRLTVTAEGRSHTRTVKLRVR